MRIRYYVDILNGCFHCSRNLVMAPLPHATFLSAHSMRADNTEGSGWTMQRMNKCIIPNEFLKCAKYQLYVYGMQQKNRNNHF